MTEPTEEQLEKALAKARDYCARGVNGLPPQDAAKAPAYLLATFDRKMVNDRSYYPQIPNKAAWFVFGLPANEGITLAGLIYADPKAHRIYTYGHHPFSGLAKYADENASELSVDTLWHLLHIEREMKGGDVRQIAA